MWPINFQCHSQAAATGSANAFFAQECYGLLFAAVVMLSDGAAVFKTLIYCIEATGLNLTAYAIVGCVGGVFNLHDQ